jgi:signal transduction histidine kinase
MYWGINTVIPLLAALAYGTLLFIVIRARPSTNARRAFRFYLLAMFFWSFGSFVSHSGFGDTSHWARVLSAAAITAPLTIFYFVQNTLDISHRWDRWAYLIGILSAAIALFTNLVAPWATITNGALKIGRGPLVYIVAIPGYGLFVYSVVMLFQRFQRSSDPIERNRLRYLISGTMIVILTTLINFTKLAEYPIDIAANLFNALLISYAIVRHELLDINIVIRRGLSYSTLIIILAATYFLPIILFDVLHVELEINQTASKFTLALMIASIFAIASHWLYGRIRERIDRFFFRERYDAYKVIQELGEQITGTLDLDQIVSSMLDRLVETLHPKWVGLLLKDPSTGDFHPAASKGLGKTLSEFHMRANHPICRWLWQEDRILSAQQARINTYFIGMWEKEREQLEELSPDLFVALRVKDGLSGILLIGPKKSDETYSLEDIDLFSTFANQVSVALDNAHLFKAINVRLAEQVALYEIGNSLARASELDDILQLVVKHACPPDTPTAKATIHLIDHDSQRLLPRAVSQSSGEPAHAVGFDPNQGIAGRAVHEKQLIYVPDVYEEPDFINTQEDFKSLVVVPLIIEGVPEGTLSVTSPYIDAFDEDMIRQLTSLGNQAAIALRKAQITDSLRRSNAELEQRSKELEASIEELKSTQRQLIQASKLASMGILTAGIAHEINNPLAGIKLFAQNTKRAHNEGRLETEKMLENMDKISALVDKAAKIIEHLRTFSRQASGDMKLIGVNKAVEDSLSMLFEQLKLQNIEVLLQLEDNLPRVRGDINQIEQVVLNLITNARDSLDKVKDKKISLRTYKDDGLVVIEVRDTGSGISPEILENVFDPFFTTKPVDKGTGLGLSISHGIVELHGGEIEVESELDRGSTFRIKLPAAES